ncbi:hypothetical protein [Microbacterium elymi]|uniref:DUF559 domain-containing protein n=1 Tax=Microbacterium elymi TaxID=2909587 RepID=A0ABY5NGZ3_9MICO|nr:hypothetical protein [Microbacterium elymi]UUT34428.1 hypothetical protein L2X98_27925 [Microbacterium elymi]
MQASAGWGSSDAAIEREVRGGLPIVAAHEAWCQLAALPPEDALGEEWLVAVADHLLSGTYDGRRWHPLCTAKQLADAVARRGRGRGTRVMRAALARARHPVGSAMETLLRLGLVDRGLPEPDVQVPVATPVGVLHADLGWPRARLLIEYQGDEHRVSRSRWLKDLTRVQMFEDAGYKTLLVGHDDISPDCTALAARISRALAAR